MRKLLALSICAVALFGLMSCQNETTSIVDQLKYSDTPNWSGTSWQGSEVEDSITEEITTVTGSATATTRTSIRLMETVYNLSLSADGTFQFTVSTVYGANWAKDYIPANWNYSRVDAATFTPPTLAADGTSYSAAFINGSFYYDSASSQLQNECIIDESETLTYNGEQVHPVTFSSTSTAALRAAALVGKTNHVNTTTGTYGIRALSNNPVNKGSVPYLTPVSERRIDRTFDDAGAVLTSNTEDSPIDSDSACYLNSYFNFTNGLVANSEGELVYSILYRGDIYREKAMTKKDMPVSTGVILYQQN